MISRDEGKTWVAVIALKDSSMKRYIEFAKR
jgi:hypothetical protein